LQYFSVTVPTVMVFGGGGAAYAAEEQNPSATTPALTQMEARVEDGRWVGISKSLRNGFFFGRHSRMPRLTASTACRTHFDAPLGFFGAEGGFGWKRPARLS